MVFRALRSDEVEVRIGTVKAPVEGKSQGGVSLLLYKDARCDMNVLDETVGEMNWQKSYSRDNRNCTVSIWDDEKKQWISKEDTGTESNTEAEKGLASDSFKRACFNWGIGRELYTAPFMWIPADKCKIETRGSGHTCYDRFKVEDIRYKGRTISYVRIKNTTTKAVIEFGDNAEPEVARQTISKTKAASLAKMLTEKSVNIDKLLEMKGVKKLEDLTEEQHLAIVKQLERSK